MSEFKVEVVPAFEPDGIIVGVDQLIETRSYTAKVQTSVKYRQISRSIAAIGLVEPPVVRSAPDKSGHYYLLDGHLRVRVLRDAKILQVLCLVSTDDEAFTYNKRISRLTAAQEHRMIERALGRGVPEAQLAEVLGIELKTLQRRATMLKGIAPGAANILEQIGCAIAVYDIFRKMVPERQLECAQLMIQNVNVSLPFAQALLSASRADDLVSTPSRRRTGVTQQDLERLKAELASLQSQMGSLEDHYGLDALHMTVARGYLKRILENERLASWLTLNRPEYIAEMREIVLAAA